jgi:DNA-binding MarR family transcriptional regulator
MPDTFDADNVARLRIALARTSRLLDRSVASGGLTRTQMSVLGTVARRGPIGIGELAEIEGVNPTMLSRVVAKLDEIDLIRRRPDPADGRAARVVITPEGAELHEQLLRQRTEVLTSMLHELPGPLAADLLNALPALEALVELIAARPSEVGAQL